MLLFIEIYVTPKLKIKFSVSLFFYLQVIDFIPLFQVIKEFTFLIYLSIHADRQSYLAGKSVYI